MGGQGECRARECLTRRRPRHDARDRVQDHVHHKSRIDREVDPRVRVRHDGKKRFMPRRLFQRLGGTGSL